jgi:hypothetical protein
MERHAGVLALSVQGAMQTPSSRIGRVGPVHCFRIVSIDQNEVRGLNAREMRLIGVHQKLRTGLVNSHREVIRYPLVKVEPRGPAKGSGEIRSLLAVAR